MAATYVSTEDTSIITRVWASFSLNDVYPEVDDEMAQDEIDAIMSDDSRLAAAYDAMAVAIATTFPNATDLWIEDTGWNGDYAQFSPRGETEDGTPYEFFFDWLDDVTQTLAN